MRECTESAQIKSDRPPYVLFWCKTTKIALAGKSRTEKIHPMAHTGSHFQKPHLKGATHASPDESGRTGATSLGKRRQATNPLGMRPSGK